MDSNQHSGVTTEQLLALLGAKEVQISLQQAEINALKVVLAQLKPKTPP